MSGCQMQSSFQTTYLIHISKVNAVIRGSNTLHQFKNKQKSCLLNIGVTLSWLTEFSPKRQESLKLEHVFTTLV